MLVSRQCCASLSVYKTINSHVTIHMCTKQVLTMFIYIYIYIYMGSNSLFYKPQTVIP
jgi:hypothetical protein